MLPAGTKKGAHLSSTCYLTFPHPKRTTQPLIWARLSRPRPAPSSCSPLGQPLHRLASPIPLTSPKRAAGGEIATPLPPRYPHCSNPHHNTRVFFLNNVHNNIIMFFCLIAYTYITINCITLQISYSTKSGSRPRPPANDQG